MKTAQTLLVALCLTSPCLITAPSHAAACANGAQGGSVTLLTDGFQAVCGDKIYSNFVGLSGLNSSGTPATWSIDENPSVGLHSFLVSGLKQSTPIAYSYKITITSASKFAGMATTSSIVAPLGITPTGVKNLSTLSYISTSTDGNNSGQVVFSPSVVGTLAFSGTLTPGPNTSFQQFTDSVYQMAPPNKAPGPLSVFGAATAIGFSRKIRSRIKAARNSVRF